MIKEDVRNYYLAYLQEKLDQKIISNGSYSLLKISESAFDDYFYQFDENIEFRNKQEEIYKSWIRDKTIGDLLK